MTKDLKKRLTKRTGASNPVWHANAGQLFLDGVVLARFSARAVNMRAVLSAFQERNWAPLVANPIVHKFGRNAKKQLHEAIKRLNKRVGHRLRFHGSGDAMGVWWQLVATGKTATRRR